jgi:hypothetical protein
MRARLERWLLQSVVLPMFVKFLVVGDGLKRAIGSKSSAKGDKCVWLLGTPCNNPPVYWAEMFNHQIRIPICEHHLHEHRVIMSLFYNGHRDVEEILNASYEEREKMMEGVELLPWDKI